MRKRNGGVYKTHDGLEFLEGIGSLYISMDEIRRMMAEIIKREGKEEGKRKIMSILRDFDDQEEKLLREWDEAKKNPPTYAKSHNKMAKELLEKERRMKYGRSGKRID